MGPSKYRKKPVVVEAMQFSAYTDAAAPASWNNGKGGDLWRWMYDNLAVFRLHQEDPGPVTMIIKTLEGEMVANIGDWIIKGTVGEFYPCKAQPFADTFELVNPTPDGGWAAAVEPMYDPLTGTVPE